MAPKTLQPPFGLSKVSKSRKFTKSTPLAWGCKFRDSLPLSCSSHFGVLQDWITVLFLDIWHGKVVNLCKDVQVAVVIIALGRSVRV